MHRTIVHMDLDSFFVSVERLLDPTLVGVPVIVGGRGKRGVVSSCSYEARKFGVRSAMPVGKALKLCPEARVVGGANYSHYSGLVTDIIRASAPLFEKTSIDEFYLDLSGMDTYFNAYEYATEIRMRIINELNLPISFGMATSKTVAKIATGLAKPNGQLRVEPGTEMAFLAPLSVAKIPYLGAKGVEKLSGVGVTHISQLQQFPVVQLEALFGKMGRVLWNKARGIDSSEIHTSREEKSISVERTFRDDSTNPEFLMEYFNSMVESSAYNLRKKGHYTTCVTVKLRKSNFETHTQQVTIKPTCLDSEILKTARELFLKAWDGKSALRLIGLKLSNFVDDNFQQDMFDDNEGKIKLHKLMDELKDKYGKSAVRKASNLGHKPIKRGNPLKPDIE